MPTLFDPLKIGDLEVPEPHRLGALDAQPVDRAGPGAERDDARLLRAARLRRPDHRRGDLGRAAGRRLSAHAGRLVRRAGRRLAQDRRAACTRRAARMFLQLWHVGRISDPIYHDGAPPVAPSAIAPKGTCQPDSARSVAYARRARSRPAKFRA